MPRPELPSGVAWLDSDRDLPGPLYPVELEAIRRAHPQRRAEFRTGRVLARAALRIAGGPAVAIPSRRRAPTWPPGYCGSITHCARYRAVAVASRRTVCGLGIDAEPAAPLPAELIDEILITSELAVLEGLDLSVPRAARIAFCAKESLVKLSHPLTGLRHSIGDFMIIATEATSPGRGFVTLRPVRPAAVLPPMITANWTITPRLIVCASVLAS